MTSDWSELIEHMVEAFARGVEESRATSSLPRAGMISDHLQASLDEQIRVESDTYDTKQPPTNGGDQKTPSCIICHHFANGVETSTPTADFLVSAGECQGCSIILQALDAVTDIRRPEFTTIDIRRKEAVDYWHLFDPHNVLNVACKQEGEPYGGGVLFGRKYVDQRPNDYQIYTPVGKSFTASQACFYQPKSSSNECGMREYLEIMLTT